MGGLHILQLLAPASFVVILMGGIANSQTLPPNDNKVYYDIRPDLSTNFYNETCPSVDEIVSEVVSQFLPEDDDLPADLVRLHFHDCFVRGCEGSALVDSTPGNLAEKDAPPNLNSLQGFEVIDKAKAEIEKICPGVVSCADIVALAARDSLLLSAGVYYPVPLGRKDGVVSIAAEASANLPSENLNFTGLVKNFASKGLTPKELITLSGAHTFGHTHCAKIWKRLYNFSSTVPTDPSLNPVYAAKLKYKCPFNKPLSDRDIPLDPTMGGETFDSLYYSNVLVGKTAFTSDSALISDPAGKDLVRTLAADPKTPFFTAFGIAMVKMGQIDVLTGNNGVIRTICSRV